jgi:hypothetical protein
VVKINKVNLYLFVFHKGFFSKILICGGFITVGQDTDNCEVVNLESTSATCKNPPKFPAKFNEAIGGLRFNSIPVICGGLQDGEYSHRGYSLKNNKSGSHLKT